jgi:ketosteroid isomerase-like protein
MSKRAISPNDLEKLFVERANAGDLSGLLALYEKNAVLDNGKGEVATGQDQIWAFLEGFLADCPQLDSSDQAPALVSGDLALTSSRLANGEITAEIARRQGDGSWLWVVDQFAVGKWR